MRLKRLQRAQTALPSMKLTGAIPSQALQPRSLQANSLPISEAPPFPDKAHCELMPASTEFSFAYSNPKPEKTKWKSMQMKVEGLWNQHFDPIHLRTGLDFATFNATLHGFKTKYDGDIAIEGYSTREG